METKATLLAVKFSKLSRCHTAQLVPGNDVHEVYGFTSLI
jgi:hypothetical protein